MHLHEPRPHLWTRDYVLLLAGTMLLGTAFFLLLPVLPLLVVGPLGGGEALVGFTVGVFSITAVLLRPFGGFLLDRFGRRTWQLGAALAHAFVIAGYLWIRTPEALLGWRLVHGLVWSLLGVANATVAADLVPQARRGAGMGIYGVVFSLALSVGPALGALLLEHGDFALVFQAGTAMSVLAFGLLVLVRTPPVRDVAAVVRWDRLVELRVGHLFLFMLPICVGYGGWLSFAPLYAPHVGLAAGTLFTAYAIGGIVTRLFGGDLYDRHGPRWPGIGGLSLVVLGWLALAVATGPFLALAGATAAGLGFGVVMPSFQAMTVDLVPPERRGAANATTFSAYDIGIGAGSTLFGLLVSQDHLGPIFGASAVLTVVAALYFQYVVVPHFHRHRVGMAPVQAATPPAR